MAIAEGSSQLLEAIRAGAKLDYLSDLHNAQFKGRVRSCIDSMPQGGYGAEEWREAAVYILRTRVYLQSPAEIRRYIVDMLKD